MGGDRSGAILELVEALCCRPFLFVQLYQRSNAPVLGNVILSFCCDMPLWKSVKEFLHFQWILKVFLIIMKERGGGVQVALEVRWIF